MAESNDLDENNVRVNLLIGCTGSVASVKIPVIIQKLLDTSLKVDLWFNFVRLQAKPATVCGTVGQSCVHAFVAFQVNIKLVCTEHALHFFDHTKLPPEVPVHRDQEEWQVGRYHSPPLASFPMVIRGDHRKLLASIS